MTSHIQSYRGQVPIILFTINIQINLLYHFKGKGGISQYLYSMLMSA